MADTQSWADRSCHPPYLLLIHHFHLRDLVDLPADCRRLDQAWSSALASWWLLEHRWCSSSRMAADMSDVARWSALMSLPPWASVEASGVSFSVAQAHRYSSTAGQSSQCRAFQQERASDRSQFLHHRAAAERSEAPTSGDCFCAPLPGAAAVLASRHRSLPRQAAQAVHRALLIRARQMRSQAGLRARGRAGSVRPGRAPEVSLMYPYAPVNRAP